MSRNIYLGADVGVALELIPNMPAAAQFMWDQVNKNDFSTRSIVLAAEIKDEQAPEIELMKSWLEAAGAPLEMGHSMTMPGLLSESQMANLEAAKGDQFDILYLLSMREHHKGAIEMAQAVVDSANSDVSALAQSIISSQTDQIAYIESLLGNN